ncbi:tape measure protein [Bremerella cremea]|uniref:tape measure protein n=1 Tax=Bremerella cremea TaxID=1031537 RepID=UPI0031E70FE1
MSGTVIANLKIMLSASWAKLRSDFGKAGQSVKGFGKQVSSGMRAALGSLQGLGGAAGAAIGQIASFGSSLAALGPIALAVAAAVGTLLGGALFAGWGVSLASETEQARVAMTTMLGDAQHADAVIQQIKETAATTPFQKGELIDAGKQLAAFGFQAGDIVPTIRMLGDVSALIGAPIGEMSELFGKAKVQGRLFMEDINQFQGRGVPIMQALAKEMGVTTAQIREMVSAGEVGFNELYRAFQSMTEQGGQFHHGMVDQAQTLDGLWSTLKDAFADLAEELGQELLPMLKFAAHAAITMMESIIWGVKEVKKFLGFEVKDFSDIISKLPKEDFSKPTEGLKQAQEELKEGTKEIKQNAIDVDQIAREVQGMRFSSSVAAYDRYTTAGFSAVQAAKQNAIDNEKKTIEIGKQILRKMDEQLAATRDGQVKVNRRRI